MMMITWNNNNIYLDITSLFTSDVQTQTHEPSEDFPLSVSLAKNLRVKSPNSSQSDPSSAVYVTPSLFTNDLVLC